MLHKKRKPSTFTNSSNQYEGRITTNNTLHSKSTYFYRWIPISCSLAFLLGTGIMLNPTINDTNKAHAETITSNPTDYSSISLTISNNGTGLNTNDTVSTDVQPGLVNYISNNLKIDTKKINRFYVSVQATEDGSSELTGTDKHAIIAPVGENKTTAEFENNTWGFALGETNVANDSMVYNSLPLYGTSTSPDYSSATNLADGSYNLKLTFAAKINADKPADHYTTKAMVSVAADAKSITMLDISKMQEMTTDICNNTASEASKQLIDDRSSSELGQTKYWVAKLKDGKCWMTQNLDLPLAQGNILKPDDTDVTANYTVPDLGNYRDPGMINYKSSTSFASSGCGDPASSACASYLETYTGSIDGDEKAHYLIGNYYPWTIAMAGKTAENQDSICPKGWKLPTQTEYGAITSLGNNTAGSNAVRLAPYYFVPAGRYTDGWNAVASYGYSWSSTPRGSNAYYLTFSSSNLGMYHSDDYGQSSGFSVRCVVK